MGGDAMSDTPRMNDAWTNPQKLSNGGFASNVPTHKLACSAYEEGKRIERELNEARDLARKLRDVLIKHHKFCAGFSVGGYNSSFSKMQREAERIITKAKGLI
jgi:hypothetical protein